MINGTVIDHTPELSQINFWRRQQGQAPVPSDTTLNVTVALWSKEQEADRKRQHDIKAARIAQQRGES